MKPRPERHDPEVFEIAFAAFWPKLWKYLKAAPDITDNTEQEWKDSAHKILHNNYEIDGYRLAKDFEDGNWSVDADFVDVADGWDDALRAALHKFIEEWITSEGIKPKLAVGTKVRVDVSPNRWKLDLRDGEVTAIMDKRGEYSVFVESAGHIRSNSGKSGVTGTLVAFDVLERLNGT
jgi:hypothetical protein